MKNKQLISLIISFLVIVSLIGVLASLLGFRLAKKNGVEVTEPDQLVGFLITTEDLNLLDMDAVMEDNIDDIIAGKVVELDDDDADEYQGRLYATVVQVTNTDEETGATYEYDDYIFKGIDGIRFFIIKHDGYTLNACDEGIFDSKISLGSIDVGKESISIEGTIYTLPGEPFDTNLYDESVYENDEGTLYKLTGEQTFLYINNVYQCADGRIYAVSGNLNVLLQLGVEHTLTQEERFAKTGDSSNQESSFSGTLKVIPQYPAELITILQMNSENAVLSREEYKPGSLPETLITNRGTDYIIVETNYMEKDAKIRTERSIISKGELTLSTIFYPEDSVWGIGQSTVLDWND
jgi:hypothetical protein